MRILQWLTVISVVCVLRTLNAAEPVISEFMAENTTTLVDEDGDRSDWIEIYNPDVSAVNLDGWFLTDSASNKAKWRFPAVSVPANGYLLVFASDKNRRMVGQQLHTNFKLDAAGEYLALVKPDGTTVSTEFAPKYPAQVPNISYGQARPIQALVLSDKGSPCRALVPSDASAGITWRAQGFNDGSWGSGTLGVGYFTSSANPNLSSDVGLPVTMQNVNNTVYVRIPFTVPVGSTISKLTLRIKYDDSFVAFLNGQFAVAAPGAPTEASLTYNSKSSANHGPTSFEDFDLTSSAGVLAAGGNVLALHGLNADLTSSDCFLLPQLLAEVTTGQPGKIGYFAAATPGQANGGNDSLRLPQTVAFSQSPGTFTAAFNLSLSGATVGQQIRYNIVGTSASGATLAEPTSASTLYTGPIPISSSTLIRAAVFDPATGQRGQTITAEYLLLETGTTNNTSNFTSILPIIVADDHGAGQPVDSGTNSFTTTLLHVFPTVNGVASLNSTPAMFTRSGTRVRGSSSAGFPKKSYGLELWNEQNLDLDQPLLGLAADSDWILNGPWLYDDTFIHNAFIYEVSRRMGRWAPRTAFVEMFFNQNGGKLDYSDYAGVYVVTEKIKSTGDRLDITSLKPNDNAGDALTGGYVFKIDRPDSNEVSWQTTNSVPNPESSQALVIVEPDPDVDTPAQIGYLKGYVQSFDTALFNERAAGFTTRNYLNYIDAPSWIDHHILNSLAYNADGLRLSGFYFKDRLGKINAGPLWDFDRALGSDDGRDSNPQSWNNIGYYFTRDWWGALFQDRDFVQAWIDRWWQLRSAGQPLATVNLTTLADQMGAKIGNAAGARDAAKWTDNAAAGGVYLNEITAMKNWLTSRVNWIDSQVPAPPSASVSSGIVNPGSSVTFSGTGTLRYTLDGTDPRPPGGGTASTALSYAGPIVINQTTVLTIRRQLPATTVFPGAVTVNWSAPITRVYLVNEVFAGTGDLAVTEVNYHPLEPTPAELASLPGITAEDFEWIELRNVGSRRVNLFEVQFLEGQPFKELKLSPMSLAPGDFALVVKNRAAFQLRYGVALSGKIAGEWGEGVLGDGGETIRILARDGTELLNFAYGTSGDWPGRADGKGSSIEYTGAGVSNTDFGNPLNWRSSSEIGGSPGVMGSGPDNRVVINEVLSHSNLPRVDAIELRNMSTAPVDLSGWWISDAGDVTSVNSFQQYRIPNGTVLPPGAYVVFTEVQFNPNGAWNPNATTPGPTEFAFDAHHGDDAWLIQADSGGNPVKFVDHVDFGAARPDESWGRWPDGTGRLYPMASRTLLDETSPTTPRPGMGGPNSLPRVGPVLITEIEHSPSGGDTDLEFVEIRNTGTSVESLAHWRLRGEVDFDFGAGETLAPGTLAVLVPFSPADAARESAFRSHYAIPASVPLLGPWSVGDHLGSAGTLTLYRAEPPPVAEPGYYPQTVEDEVRYSSVPPWKTANGGLSLNRRGVASPSDAASSWKVGEPSPGFTNVSYALWKNFYFPGGGAGSDAAEDFDGDGLSNAAEYGLSTHPRIGDPASALPSFARQLISGADSWSLTFTKPNDRPDATYQVQQSTDLVNWQNVPDQLISTGIDSEVRRAAVGYDAATPTLFFRLQVKIGP
ncbi:lamin tail domain-containing protein [Verrucomicrobiota bacterium sgz303538]